MHARLHDFPPSLTYNIFHTVIVVGGDIYTYYGEEVSLACFTALGSGVYSFDWLVPDGSTALSRGQVITSGSLSQLTFTALEEDSGEYTCLVQSGSEMGSDSTTVTIGNFNRGHDI